jgi:nitrous oxidase accessory protein NosD
LDLFTRKTFLVCYKWNDIIKSNSYGIYSGQYSRFNNIVNNNFIENNGALQVFDKSHIQAFDMSGSNMWNTSTEGNYWSDWTIPDNNHDGIVDSPYVLAGGTGSKDSFPHVNPVSDTGVIPSESPPITLIITVVILIAVPAIIITALVMRQRKLRR